MSKMVPFYRPTKVLTCLSQLSVRHINQHATPATKVRALLAKSRIELGQYERGLTDCGVASRLLDFEERLLGEREAEQVSGSAAETSEWSVVVVQVVTTTLAAATKLRYIP